MMAVQAALPPADGGLGGTVLYIDTEGAFTAERLLEMARERCAESGLLNLVDRVKIVTDATCAALLQRLRSLEGLVIKWNLRLVIVDSIASVIRKECVPSNPFSCTSSTQEYIGVGNAVRMCVVVVAAVVLSICVSR